MYTNYNRNDGDIGKTIAGLIVLIILFFIVQSCSVSSSRSVRNMEPIENGYCYNMGTGIIYIESYAGRYGTETVYTAYFDKNGNMCRYDQNSGAWMPIINKEK